MSGGATLDASLGLRAMLVAQVAMRARIAPSEVRADAHLVVELGLSSLDLLDVIAYAEQRFNARFPDELLATLVTIEKIEEALFQHAAALSGRKPS
jgi:acyl carrier protein